MRYQWIARFIDNHLVGCDEVMEPFVREVLAQSSAMTSHGSSPCPTNPAPSQRSTRPRAAASSRCSPTSNRAASVQNRANCARPWLGRLLLVMSLALYFAVSTGLNDTNTNPTVDEKKDRDIGRET